MSTEAARAASRRYQQKNKDKAGLWGTQFWRKESERFDEVIKAHNMNRADLIRWGIEKLSNQQGDVQ
jgi:hypothetical protein